MKLMPRDESVLELISKFKVCDSTHIYRLFFKGISTGEIKARARLKKLVENKALKRSRTYTSEKYIYYLKKPKQLEHSLLVTEAYTRLSELCEVTEFIPEFIIGDIRADAFVVLDKNKTYFFEVELSHNPFNWRKYIDLYNSGIVQKEIGAFPTLVGITNKRIKIPELPFKSILIKTDLKNIEEVLK